MKTYVEQTFDEERALYGVDGVEVVRCRFEGPADGESAMKEGRNIKVRESAFLLRYPFWHDTHLSIRDSEMTETCRAALWYSRDISIINSRLHGIKALRECDDVSIEGCDIVSQEFGWFSRNVQMRETKAESEYFMLRAADLTMDRVQLCGKYSFQYITDSRFTGCTFDTKDAFWHAKNVHVKDSFIRGEYLGWYCENVTFENCTIIGTQPLCYCKGLRLINCRMEAADLAFEKSEVEATILTAVDSIKNPKSGTIRVPSVGEIIRDDPESEGQIEIGL